MRAAYPRNLGKNSDQTQFEMTYGGVKCAERIHACASARRRALHAMVVL